MSEKETTVVRDNNSCFGATTVTRELADGTKITGYGRDRERANDACEEKVERYKRNR